MRNLLSDLAEIYNILDQDDSQCQFNSVIAPHAFQVSQDSTQPSICLDLLTQFSLVYSR